ncbi:hypothetical protein Nepgr_009800 [Nepenthes gracilis]|uniref:Homeobox-leucine zipper protein n=1 Tax=Nepenthes gracilis TaxID=150966 RepID=A0AAD3SBZ0_NEPGR|nr:hypothetical protein Nepgr_009800 [Nepenthes gracilis]
MDSRHLLFDPSAYHQAGMLRSPLSRGSTWMMRGEEIPRRLPFFGLPEELYDDEFDDGHSPGKKRRLTPEQVYLLEETFEAENKLKPERKSELAKKLGLQPRQVAVWFQNRRARWKTKQLERDFDLLKASYNTLRSNYDSILKENNNLKSEVLSLTEKLQRSNGLPTAGPKMDLLGVDVGLISAQQLSSGGGGSAVVNESNLSNLVNSGDSYLPNHDGSCRGGDDHSQSYFSDVFLAAEQQHQEDQEEALGWWVWS